MTVFAEAPARAAASGSPGTASVTSEAAASADEAAAAARVDAVVLEIAGLAQRAQTAEAAEVGAELATSGLEQSLQRLHAQAAGVMVDAYVNDSPDRSLSAPGPYLRAAQRVEDGVLARYRDALDRARAARELNRARLESLSRIQVDLEVQRQALGDLVGAAQARVDQERSADAAALAASNATRAAAAAAARAGAGPGGGPSPLPGGGAGVGGAAGVGPPSAISLTVTKEQLSLMARYPFGPLPGAPAGFSSAGVSSTAVLPPGLVASGAAFGGVASWYGPGFDGQPTATGAVYDENAWTVASTSLPLGTFLVVRAGARAVLLLVNDRGPYVTGRVLDLSHAAAEALGSDGLIDVTAQVVSPASIGS